MCGKRVWLLGVCVCLVLLLVVLVVAACGGSTTDTTSGPSTTAAGPTTTAAAPTTTAAAPTTTAAGIDAAALYARDCKGCHADGKPGAAADIATAIKSGVGSSMPGFSDKMSADEITALAAYVAGGGK